MIFTCFYNKNRIATSILRFLTWGGNNIAGKLLRDGKNEYLGGEYFHMVKTFEDFPVYKKGLELVKEIDLLCGKVRGSQFLFIKDQIRRALASVLLNIAEGSVKWTRKDKMNFYRMGQASACECIAALDLFQAYQIIDYKYAQKLKKELNEVVRDLQALVNSIHKRPK